MTEKVSAQTSAIADYTRDELIDSLCFVIPKNYSLARADAITAVDHQLGFRRVTDTVTNEIKGAINGAIRREILAYEGELIWRVT